MKLLVVFIKTQSCHQSQREPPSSRNEFGPKGILLPRLASTLSSHGYSPTVYLKGTILSHNTLSKSLLGAPKLSLLYLLGPGTSL